MNYKIANLLRVYHLQEVEQFIFYRVVCFKLGDLYYIERKKIIILFIHFYE